MNLDTLLTILRENDVEEHAKSYSKYDIRILLFEPSLKVLTCLVEKGSSEDGKYIAEIGQIEEEYQREYRTARTLRADVFPALRRMGILEEIAKDRIIARKSVMDKLYRWIKEGEKEKVRKFLFQKYYLNHPLFREFIRFLIKEGRVETKKLSDRKIFHPDTNPVRSRFLVKTGKEGFQVIRSPEKGIVELKDLREPADMLEIDLNKAIILVYKEISHGFNEPQVPIEVLRKKTIETFPFMHPKVFDETIASMWTTERNFFHEKYRLALELSQGSISGGVHIGGVYYCYITMKQI